MKKAAHVVFIPSPGVGHLVSTLQFAKLLINRDHRLRVTILIIKLPHKGETDTHTTSLASSSAASAASSDERRLHVINLPECTLPPTTNSDPRASTIALLEAQKPNVREAVSNLKEQPPAAFILDMFCTTMIDVAKEFQVPAFVFFTSGVAFLGLVLHLHTLREKNQVQATDLQDSITGLDIPTFSNMVPSNLLPSSVLRKEFEPIFLTYGKGLKKADGIIVNSFEELESYAVRSFSANHPALDIPIYPVGPIINFGGVKGTIDDESGSPPVTKITHSRIYSVFDDPNSIDDCGEDSNMIIKWLDHQPSSSVIFLCFGSKGYFDEEQVREIARAIEDSGARFLWSLRKPSPKGSMSQPTYYTVSDLAAILPEGFLDRTVEIGRVVGWVPQAKVLAHSAIGGFVSHCGWNSTLESVYFGVPIATWPLFAEQQTNAFELVCELKIAVEIALDYRMEFDTGRNYLLTADKIERGIRSLLQNDGEIEKKMKEMSENSRKTLLPGGSSYAYLGRLIDYIMNQV